MAVRQQLRCRRHVGFSTVPLFNRLSIIRNLCQVVSVAKGDAMILFRNSVHLFVLSVSMMAAIDAETCTAEENSGGKVPKFVSIFDGKTLIGWEGDESVFRVEDGAIIGGQLKEKIPHNFFLATKQEYRNFELRLEFRLLGDDTNAGVQIRSRRIPDHHEMIGYQADLGQNYWGALYDESRRNRILAAPGKEDIDRILRRGEWNRYRILCEGRRIQLWINDFQTVNYEEPDESLEQTGLIALQIHGGPPGEAQYRNLQIRELP